MLKVFRDYIGKEISKKVIEIDPAFLIRKKKLGAPYSGSVILQKNFNEKFVGYIHIQFVNSRNYVIPSIQWSLTGNYPNEAECRENQEELKARNISCEDVRNQLSEGWMNATDFGRFTNYFEMQTERPPRNRIRDAYNTPEARAIISADPFLVNGEWEGNDAFDSWDTMVAITGLQLSDHDAEYAVGDLVLELINFIERHFIPFLNKEKSLF